MFPYVTYVVKKPYVSLYNLCGGKIFYSPYITYVVKNKKAPFQQKEDSSFIYFVKSQKN